MTEERIERLRDVASQINTKVATGELPDVPVMSLYRILADVNEIYSDMMDSIASDLVSDSEKLAGQVHEVVEAYTSLREDYAAIGEIVKDLTATNEILRQQVTKLQVQVQMLQRQPTVRDNFLD